MKYTAAIVVIAFVSAIAVSVIGQEEPLPVVTPKASIAGEVPLAQPAVVLAVEPILEFETPTLMSAARNNDYVTFDALYTAAKNRGEDVSRFATLHELWTYSVTDPIGAFYGRDLYETLSRAYPGYATYIEEFAIVDSRGNTFYPTSETRAFLLDRVNEPRTPRVQIAEDQPTPPRPDRVVPASLPAPRVVQASLPAPRAAASAADAPVAEADKNVYTTPLVVTPAQVQQQPQPSPAPVEKVTQLPATAPPIPQVQPTRPLASRGLLLVILGLIGIGLLAIILRTPREKPSMKIMTGNVEQLRKSPVTPPATPPADKRATG